MCRSHTQGYKRCKGSAATKARESLRKSINYQAKKSGIPVAEWKTLNPDLLEKINNTYDERLQRFKNKMGDDCPETSTKAISTEIKNNMLRSIFKDERSSHPHRYDFAGKGEARGGNSSGTIQEYMANAEKYSAAIKLNAEEKHAILCYSNDMYSPLNSYFLKKDMEGIFRESYDSWRDSGEGWQSYFKNEEDLIDYSNTLDSALEHRTGEPRVIYRGLNVSSMSKAIVANNGGKEVTKSEDRKKIMENIYNPGTELAFDAYSSASDSIDIAADWCNSHATWNDAPTGVLFEIKSSAGVPIAHTSGHKDEREVLLPRGMKFKVQNSYWNSSEEDSCYKYESMHKFGTMLSKNPNILVVQLIEVDEESNEITDHTAKYVAPPIVVRSEVEGDGK